MIEQITIENFKSFGKVELRLGRLNLFIGANASGKSNVFDALRVLRGAAGGFPLRVWFQQHRRDDKGAAGERREDGVTGESRILPLTQIPHFTEVVKRQPISDLLAEGWMEAVL